MNELPAGAAQVRRGGLLRPGGGRRSGAGLAGARGAERVVASRSLPASLWLPWTIGSHRVGASFAVLGRLLRVSHTEGMLRVAGRLA